MLRFFTHDGVLDFSEHVTMISYVGLFHCAIDFFELIFFFNNTNTLRFGVLRSYNNHMH